MSMINQPSHFTSDEILSWINKNKDNPVEVFKFLTDCRKQNLGDNFPQKSLDTTDKETRKQRCYDTICHALLTNDLNSVNLKRLQEARDALADPTMIDPDVILKIVEFILQVIIAIIKYFQTHPLLRAKKDDSGFINFLKELKGNNPLINLPNIHLENASLDNVDLSGINLEGAQFSNVSMKNAKFDNSSLRGAQFEWCDLTDACFHEADISWARIANSLTQKTTGIDNMDLVNYLKTDFDKKPSFSPPSIERLTNALDQIHKDLKSENNAEANILRRLHKKMERHYFHEIVAQNIVKLSEQVSDPRVRYDMLMDVYNHHFYAGHNSAHMAKGLDSFIHRLFKVKSSLPVVSNHNQHILLKALHELESQVAEANKADKPAPSFSRN